MTRIVSIVLLFMLTGCVTSSRNTSGRILAEHSAAQVYLFRGGVGGIFSRGLDEMAAECRSAGIEAFVLPYWCWRDVALDVPSGRRGHRLILIGHSMGADVAIGLARDLDRSGASVDLLITLDPVYPPPVPPNVRQCWNVFQARPGFLSYPFFKGQALQSDFTSCPRVENLNLWTSPNDLHDANLSHWNMTRQRQLQRAIVQRVLTVCQDDHD